MAFFAVTLPESWHGQPDHGFKSIKAALEASIGVKCHFSVSHGSYENNECGSGEPYLHGVGSRSSNSTRKTLGTESKISKDNQIKNPGNTLILSILFDTDLSMEKISKAKNLVEKHLSSAAHCIIREVPLATQRDFDMVVRNAASIQSESSALLTFDRETHKISIHGSEDSVKCAHAQIGKIIDNLDQHESWSQSIDSDYTVIYKNQRAMTNSSELCGNKTNQQDDDTLSKFIAEVNSQVETEADTESSEFSDSEEEGDHQAAGENIILDRRFSKHVETGLKLGYSEDNVKKALLKLGEDCDPNDLLSELILLGNADIRPLKSTETEQGEGYEAISSIVSTDGCVSQETAELALSPNGGSVSADAVKLASDPNNSDNLRHIIIDGSNVAMSHGKESFSCKGIKIAVDWFRARGHNHITAFVPKWRKESSRPDALITDQELLKDLERENVLAFTPARRVKGKRIVCYDDRFILQLAEETDGIVVSNDVYRDLVSEKEAFRQVVDQRLLMYTFVGDRFMPPEDPLGRSGPTLDNFLRKVPVDPRPRPQDCPFGKKCTYGNKCRFYHPERGFAHQKLVSETLKEQADAKLQERAQKMEKATNMDKERGRKPKQTLKRTKSLVPGTLLPSRQNSDVFARSISKTDKPKLSHSTSLNSSTFSKSSDYLDDARRKFEEAELLPATERLSLQKRSWEKKITSSPEFQNVSLSQTKNKKSSKLLPSDFKPQSFSPTDAVEISAWQVASGFGPSPMSGLHIHGGLMPETTSISSKGSKKAKPRKPSPSHLPVPKQSEPYVSGHLELAQKLSDEGSESNFFSEHTSSKSASSTPRTTSPIVQPSSLNAQNSGKPKSSSGTLEMAGEVSQLRPELMGSQGLAGSQTGHTDVANALAAGIPNLSIFDVQGQNSMSQQASQEQSETLTARGFDSIHGISATLPYPPNTFTQSADIQGPYEPNLKRPVGRKMSEVSVNPITPKHMPLKPQMSVPVAGMSEQQAFVDSRGWNVPIGLSRQNSSSDPQIHMSAGEHPQFNANKSLNPPISGTVQSNLAGPQNTPYSQLQAGPNARPYNMSGGPHQVDTYPISQVRSQGEFQPSYHPQIYSQKFQHQQQTQHQQAYFTEQQSPSFGLNQFSPMGSSGSSDGYAPPYQPTMQPPPPALLSYQQERPFLSPQYQVPQLASTTYTSTNTIPPPIMGMQPMFTSPPVGYSEFPPNFANPLTSWPPPGRMMQGFSNQPPPPMYYPVPASVPQSNMRYPSPTIPLIPAEDMPIPTTDPRHSLYSHLSTVFQESVVRKVMNRNPRLTKPDDVFNKIWDYVNSVNKK